MKLVAPAMVTTSLSMAILVPGSRSTVPLMEALAGLSEPVCTSIGQCW